MYTHSSEGLDDSDSVFSSRSSNTISTMPSDNGSVPSTAPTDASHHEAAPSVQGEEHDWSDTDSAIGSMTGSSTYTASTSAFRFPSEHGRRYHAYHEGQYIMPNDELEQNKLYLAHLVNYVAIDGELFLAPLKMENVQRVLDIGTGAGDWAIDFAERYPDVQVLGTDLSPIQPSWVPANCVFEVDDAEDEWLYDQPFDFIHTRTLCGGIRDWPNFYQSAYNHLRPGGWIELQENDAWFQRMDGTNPENTNQFLHLLDEAAIKRGCRINVAKEQKQHLIAAGFEDVYDVVYKLPLCEWHSDPKVKEIGRLRGAAMRLGVEGYSLALYTRYLNWTAEELRILLAKVRTEFGEKANQMYIAQHFIYGRKPGGPPQNIRPHRPNMPPEMWEYQ